MLAGGIAGVVGAMLLDLFDNSWVPLAIYTFLLALITTVITLFTPETKGRDLLAPADAVDEQRSAGIAARGATRP